MDRASRIAQHRHPTYQVFYLYAICGMIIFAPNDPWHFGNLTVAIFSLFRAATLEDWTDLMYIRYVVLPKTTTTTQNHKKIRSLRIKLLSYAKTRVLCTKYISNHHLQYVRLQGLLEWTLY
jgi:hypothetical protein